MMSDADNIESIEISFEVGSQHVLTRLAPYFYPTGKLLTDADEGDPVAEEAVRVLSFLRGLGEDR